MAGRSKAKPADLTEEISPVAEIPAETETQEPEAEQASFFVYLGPTIMGVIQNASIYTGTRDDVEKKLARVIAKYPRVKVLLIPGDAIVQGRDDVTKPGTRLYAEYRRMVRELKK